MSIFYLLIGFSLLIALGFLVGFLWAVKSGQYEDEYTPSVRMLLEDKPVGGNENENQTCPEYSRGNQNKNSGLRHNQLK